MNEFRIPSEQSEENVLPKMLGYLECSMLLMVVCTHFLTAFQRCPF